MLTIHTNTLSNITQRNFTQSTNALRTSLERLSTGFKINKAADNASNLAISKKMNCQISGTNVAQENTQQAMGLLDTADGALAEMTEIVNRIRDLSLQSMNGTYSDGERAKMQEEVNALTLELYRQRNSTKYNKIDVFGHSEKAPSLVNTGVAAISGGGGL